MKRCSVCQNFTDGKSTN
ncbi:hypothetical protein [Paenisporosarcina sp. TG20]